MAKVFRFSGYAVGSHIQDNDIYSDDVYNYLNDELHSCGFSVSQLHVDESVEFEWSDKLPIADENCDLQYLENMFKEDDNDIRKNSLTKIYENFVVVGGIYKHFKGKLVKVLAVSRHSETNQVSVVYVCENGKVFNRPIDMFFNKVDKEKYPDVVQESRFEFVTTFK